MKHFTLFFVCFFGFHFGYTQCNADAGADIHRCSPDSIVQFGGNPTAIGGTPPYTYLWSMDPIPTQLQSMPFIYASHMLDDTTAANPNFIYNGSFLEESMTFYLTVTDAAGSQSMDTILLTTSIFGVHLIIYEFTINKGDSVYLNFIPNICCGFGDYSYVWSPSHGLSDTTLAMGFWAKPDTTIVYHATVTDSKGCQKSGAPFYFIFVNTVGIDEPSEDQSELLIYPNPTSDNISLVFNKDIIVKEIKLLSLNGMILYSQKENLDFVELDQFPSGIYIVEIHFMNDQIVRRKIVKM